MILRLHHAEITVPPDRVDEARSFYCGILGLREIEKAAALKPRGGFWLELGDAQLHVGIEEGVNRDQTKAHVAYEVSDLEICRSTLAAHGIKTKESIAIPGWRRFEFRDPFGNRVEFLQKVLS